MNRPRIPLYGFIHSVNKIFRSSFFNKIYNVFFFFNRSDRMNGIFINMNCFC
nr:MAG TPA: hypothetical protein [Caudoviricetes sp.]